MTVPNRELQDKSIPSLSHLHSVTNRLLDLEKDNFGEMFTVCNELYSILIQLTGVDPEEVKNRKDIPLGAGNALGLIWAAMCIKDFMRTKRFTDGIAEAVSNKVKSSTGRRVHILYAGTGPFATLVLPLTARFTSEQIQFTFLDVNEESLNCVRKLFGTLQMEKYIHRMEKADAAEWTIPSGEQIDIFISETMQRGLRKEPQVAICMNIVPQLSAEAIMIPEEIILNAALIDERKRIREKLDADISGDSVHLLGTVFTLNKKSILQLAKEQNKKTASCFPEVKIHIPSKISDGHKAISLLTDITIFNREKLLIDESQLTIPLKLTDLKPPFPEEIVFRYYGGVMPEMKFSLRTITELPEKMD